MCVIEQRVVVPTGGLHGLSHLLTLPQLRAGATGKHGGAGETTARKRSTGPVGRHGRRLEFPARETLSSLQNGTNWVTRQRYAPAQNLRGGISRQSPGEITGERSASLSTIRYTGMGEWVAGKLQREQAWSMTRPREALRVEILDHCRAESRTVSLKHG